jgi:hypothetical protein
MGVQIQMNTTTITHLLQLVSNLSNWTNSSNKYKWYSNSGFSRTYTNVVTVGNVITTQPANKVTVAGGNTVFL